jgi:aspartyl-tRNA(Asn)/glutamyl-tRNA(Gln) amidotransferase subunit C
MTDTERVSLEDVRRVAELASLELTADEEPGMRRDLNAILDHVAQLNELDTSRIAPMAQVAEILSTGQDEINVLRPDAALPCLDRTQVMASAPETDGVFFKVPKVIER